MSKADPAVCECGYRFLTDAQAYQSPTHYRYPCDCKVHTSVPQWERIKHARGLHAYRGWGREDRAGAPTASDKSTRAVGAERKGTPDE